MAKSSKASKSKGSPDREATASPAGPSMISSGDLPPLSKLQGFRAVTIDRRRIKNADYNPRTLTPAQRRKLRRSIEKFKLVETLVWNSRTGNLVGGHQRLAQVDDLEGTDAYSLTVAEISVDEATERAINIALNNPELQGQYDLDLLTSVVSNMLSTSPKLVEDAGFDRSNLAMLLGDDFLSPGAAQQAEHESADIAALNAMYEAGAESKAAARPAVQPGEQSAGADDAEQVDDGVERYGKDGWTKQDFKDRRAEFKGQKNLLDEANVYLTLTFDSTGQVGELLERYGLNPNLRTVDASFFLSLLGVELVPASEFSGHDSAGGEDPDGSLPDPAAGSESAV